jgi:hypothetical protein
MEPKFHSCIMLTLHFNLYIFFELVKVNYLKIILTMVGGSTIRFSLFIDSVGLGNSNNTNSEKGDALDVEWEVIFFFFFWSFSKLIY